MINTLAHISFMLVAAAIFFGSHYFFYFSIVKFFTIVSSSVKLYLLIGITCLSLSLFVTSFLAHYFVNSFTRYAYVASGIWLGTFVNFLLAAIFVWLCIGVAKYLHFNLNPASIFSLATVIVVATCFFGVKNAYDVQVKKIKVEIKNLPEAWRGKTIVQISDVHLGNIYQSDFLEGVVEKINALNPEAVVITGDLFDGMDGNLDPLVLPLNKLKTEKGTYFITGNHETYLGVNEALRVLAKTNVKVLNDEVVDVSGLKIIGISYPESFVGDDEVAKLQALQPEFFGQPNILLYHAPANISEAKELGVNLQLSGHTHVGQQFPFNFVTKAIYKGYDYGLHTLGDFSIYTTSGVGTWGIPMRLGTQSEIVAIELE